MIEANDPLTANHSDRDAVESHPLQLVERHRILADVFFGKRNLPLGKPRFHLVARPSPGAAIDSHFFRHLHDPPRWWKPYRNNGSLLNEPLIALFPDCLTNLPARVDMTGATNASNGIRRRSLRQEIRFREFHRLPADNAATESFLDCHLRQFSDLSH